MNTLIKLLGKQIDQTEKLAMQMRQDLSETVKELSPDVTFVKALTVIEDEVMVMGLDAPVKKGRDYSVKRKVSTVSGISFVEYGEAK